MRTSTASRSAPPDVMALMPINCFLAAIFSGIRQQIDERVLERNASPSTSGRLGSTTSPPAVRVIEDQRTGGQRFIDDGLHRHCLTLLDDVAGLRAGETQYAFHEPRSRSLSCWIAPVLGHARRILRDAATQVVGGVWMTVSGVRSSCDTPATKSIWSSASFCRAGCSESKRARWRASAAGCHPSRRGSASGRG